MKNDASRKEFENWAKRSLNAPNFDKKDGQYSSSITRKIWDMWTYAYLLGAEDGAASATEAMPITITSGESQMASQLRKAALVIASRKRKNGA